MKNQPIYSAKKQANHKQEVTADTKNISGVKQTVAKSDDRVKFLSKCFLLLAFVVAVVGFTDSKEYFVGDQMNNHSQRKWRSFYRFADEENKNADIVVFGNSHASAGVEPYIVSMATGTYCFILNTAGTAAIDAYFNLKEILAHNNKPKVVILETLCLNLSEIGEEWGRIQSYDAKQFSLRKVLSMPYLFKPDEWVKSWSTTVRNHGFLLTDSARMAFNFENVGTQKNPDRSKLDLGRFSHGQTALMDSTIAKYAKPGIQVKCDSVVIAKENIYYVKKLYDLCKANNIELMLFTAPMYHKTYDNYAIQKKKDLIAFKDIPNLKWLDLQDGYDTTLYTKEAFNDEAHGAQHNTYYGMTLNSYKLSKFIVDNYGAILPKRQQENNWINDFSFTDFDFAFNNNVPTSMTAYSVVTRNQSIDKFTIKEFVTKADKNSTTLILKLDNHPDLKETVNVVVEIENQNQRSTVPLTLACRKDVFPPAHKVYLGNFAKGLKVLKISKVQ